MMRDVTKAYAIQKKELIRIGKEDFLANLGALLSTFMIEDAERRSWEATYDVLREIMDVPAIPEDMTLAFEYRLPLVSKRIDVMLTGRNTVGMEQVVVIELKQWGRADHYLTAELVHPCDQVLGYASLLKDYNCYIQRRGIQVTPIVLMPECDDVSSYREYETVETYGRRDVETLQSRLAELLAGGDRGQKVLQAVASSEVSPAPALKEQFRMAVEGRLGMIDEQKRAFDAICKAIHSELKDHKVLLQVIGDPGTGKSVIALNVMATLLHEQSVCYVSPYRKMPLRWYLQEMVRDYRCSHHSDFSPLFCDVEDILNDEKTYDVIIVDEAHNLTYNKSQESQANRLIDKCRVLVLLMDGNQSSMFYDVMSSKYFADIASARGMEHHTFNLKSEFRCGGSDCYIDWLDDMLCSSRDPKEDLSADEFEFVICDDPAEVEHHIRERIRQGETARMLMGDSWLTYKDGKSLFRNSSFSMGEKDPKLFPNRWASSDLGEQTLGSVHDCAGLEFDYVGVLMLQDICFEQGQVKYLPDKNRTLRSSGDYCEFGLGYVESLLDWFPQMADRLVRNAYYTLLTRGIKGCYVYIHDTKLRQYFRSHIKI